MSFKEELEATEGLDKVLRRILEVTTKHMNDGLEPQEDFEILVTFNPHFQMKLNEYVGPAHTYEWLNSRTIHGWPWFSLSNQTEEIKVWSYLTK